MEKKPTCTITQARPEEGQKKHALVPVAEKLAIITQWLNEHKARRVVCLDLAGQGGFADAMLVCSAGSVRHAQSLAEGVSALCAERALEYLRMEGYEAGQWILVDLNDVIVHIFLEPVRDLYRLEELWQRSPLRDLPAASARAEGAAQ